VRLVSVRHRFGESETGAKIKSEGDTGRKTRRMTNISKPGRSANTDCSQHTDRYSHPDGRYHAGGPEKKCGRHAERQPWQHEQKGKKKGN
jgi:hypothetical protein